MCLCASCSYTDAFSGREDLFSDGSPTIKGFDNWPRGKPAGKRASDKAYREHVAELWQGVARHAIAFKPGQAPQYDTRGVVHPVAPMPAWWYAWNKASPARAEPARTTTPCKAPQHFPERDRTRGTAVIYAMRKAKPQEKKPVGRPALPGRRVVIKLEERHIKRAAELGDKNIAAGIRKALER